jgi:hypothetical protein
VALAVASSASILRLRAASVALSSASAGRATTAEPGGTAAAAAGDAYASGTASRIATAAPINARACCLPTIRSPTREVVTGGSVRPPDSRRQGSRPESRGPFHHQ